MYFEINFCFKERQHYKELFVAVHSDKLVIERQLT